MQLIFADEFGDFSSPLTDKSDPGFRPIFGYGGIAIRSDRYRQLADNFYKLRIVADRNILFRKMAVSNLIEQMYRTDEIAAAMRFEIKGRDVFSTSYLSRGGISPAWKKANVFQYARWFLRMLAAHGAEIIYSGAKKDAYYGQLARNGRTLKRSPHVELIRDFLGVSHRFARERVAQTKLIFDHHPKDDETIARTQARNKKISFQSRPELQTRQEYCREIILEKGYYDYMKEPLFHVQSEWSAGVQVADWVCTLITKIKSFEIDNAEFSKYHMFHNKLGQYVDNLTISQSHIRFFGGPPERQLKLPLT